MRGLTGLSLEGERGQAKMLPRDLASQVFDIPAEEVGPRLVGPHSVVGHSQRASASLSDEFRRSVAQDMGGPQLARA